MSLRYRLLFTLARVVCRLRGHRYVYGKVHAFGVNVVSRRCRRCQHVDHRAIGQVRFDQAARPLADELPAR